MVQSAQRSGDHSLLSLGPPAWLSGYRRSWLTRDAVAGLTLWALVVPEAMAYASIAGVPAQFGLYAVPLAVLAYAWLGTSTRLFVGPSSTICALTATVVAPLAVAGGEEYVLLTAVLSLIVGVVFIALGLLRMGFLSRLFAEPVLDGFIVGLGLYIAVGQLPKLVGLEKPEGNTVQQLGGLLREVGDWNLASILLGGGALAALFLLHRFAPKVPAALVVVVVSHPPRAAAVTRGPRGVGGRRDPGRVRLRALERPDPRPRHRARARRPDRRHRRVRREPGRRQGVRRQGRHHGRRQPRAARLRRRLDRVRCAAGLPARREPVEVRRRREPAGRSHPCRS